MKLGVYIGSFDPVHKGHIDVVKYLLKNKIVDRVLMIPTGGYWHKTDLTDIQDRINMLKIFETDNILVDDKHNDIQYTYLLMNNLKEEYNDELYLILGADNIINFDKWKNYQELLKYKIIVMNRDNIDVNEYIKKYNTTNFIVLNDYPFIDISSTEIRANLDNCYLDEKVLEYIKEKKLYK